MDTYSTITLDEALKRTDIPQAAHCSLWFREKTNEHKGNVFILMQMRADGTIGFPGGYVDEQIVDHNAIIAGLNRELKEEIDYSQDIVRIENYICSHLRRVNPLIVHFFSKELTKQQFEFIEKTHTRAIHFPSESLGLFRVPLRTMLKFKEFWNNFLQNQFAGNSKDQLLFSILKLKLINTEQYEQLSSSTLCSIRIDETTDK